MDVCGETSRMTTVISIEQVSSTLTIRALQRDVKREILKALSGKVSYSEKLPRICDTRAHLV